MQYIVFINPNITQKKHPGTGLKCYINGQSFLSNKQEKAFLRCSCKIKTEPFYSDKVFIAPGDGGKVLLKMEL